MKNIVIDTSALIAVILEEPEKDHLIELTWGAHLLAPSSLHWEIGNAFSAMFKKRKISLDSAISAIKIYQKIPIRFVDIELKKAIELAHVSKIYAYDSYMLICSKAYKAPLLTLDNVLKKLALNQKIEVLEA